jgi:hypothetical protein
VRRPLLRISERNLLASAANGRGFFALWRRFIAAWWDVQRVSPSARRAFASSNSYLAGMNCLNELPETRKAKQNSLWSGDTKKQPYLAAPWTRHFNRLCASVEGQTDAESLLSRRSFGTFQLFRDLASGSFLSSK